MDGPVKSSRCKARESLGMRRNYQYVAMTKDEAQRRRWTFYEAVIDRFLIVLDAPESVLDSYSSKSGPSSPEKPSDRVVSV